MQKCGQTINLSIIKDTRESSCYEPAFIVLSLALMLWGNFLFEKNYNLFHLFHDFSTPAKGQEVCALP